LKYFDVVSEQQQYEKKWCFEIVPEDMHFNDDDVTVSSRGEADNCACRRKNYHRELLCDCCGATFRSCCVGYSREPMVEPSYPFTGAKVTLPAFCSTCLVAKGLTQDVVLAQEDEYFALVKYFEPAAGMGWRWIPGVCNKFSMFSVVWLHLQQFGILYSPFFCGIGSGFDVTLEKDPQFMAFISRCAEEALSFVEVKGDWTEYVKVWSAIYSNPASVPQYLHSQALTYTGKAIAQYLNTHDTSEIRIWQFDTSCGVLKRTASFGSRVSARKIDILIRNRTVETRCDLIVPRHEMTNSVLF
jgi:hypothetical protein